MPGSSEENRYGFLLNPIKDLTKNWQVDLAKFLGDYLDELAHTQISIDGGETVMNFAEAAMLIQGSACVYGRKVEFLWKMVVQMLELLASKKAGGKQGTKNKRAAGHDPNETMGFLPMEDIPMCKKHVKEEPESKSNIKLLPITPVCLVDKDKTLKAVPLLAINGDLLGNKEDFRLNSTMSSLSGMLCTEKDIEALQNCHIKTSFSPSKAHRSPDITMAEACGAAYRPQEDIADIGDDLGGGPASPPSPGPAPPSPEPATPQRAAHEPPDPPDLDQPDTRPPARQLRRRHNEAPPITLSKEQWKPRDLYEEGAEKRRPVRKGRITRRAPCLCSKEAAGKRKRRSAQASEEAENTAPSVYADPEPAPLPAVSEFLKPEMLSPTTRLTRSRIRDVHPQLRPELIKELERRNAELLELKVKTRDDSTDEKDPDLLAGGDGAALSDDESVGGGAGDFPDPVDHEADLPTAHARLDADAAQPAPDSYEERVQKRVAEYLSAAQEYIQSTELSRRVAQWQEAVTPRLQAEERRKEFNIHDYGSRILARFPPGDAKSTLSFAEVVQGEEAPEVARYLLASLMLANTYNVEVTDRADPFDGMDAMELTLLSRRRHHEDLDEYSAPSQGSPRRKSQEGGSGASVRHAARSSPRHAGRGASTARSGTKPAARRRKAAAQPS